MWLQNEQYTINWGEIGDNLREGMGKRSISEEAGRLGSQPFLWAATQPVSTPATGHTVQCFDLFGHLHQLLDCKLSKGRGWISYLHHLVQDLVPNSYLINTEWWVISPGANTVDRWRRQDITAKDMSINEGVKTHCMLRKQWVVWSGLSMAI